MVKRLTIESIIAFLIIAALIIFVARLFFLVFTICLLISLIAFIPLLITDFVRSVEWSVDLDDLEDFGDLLDLPYTYLVITIFIISWVSAGIAFNIGYNPISSSIVEINSQIQGIIGLPDQIFLETMNDVCISQPSNPSCPLVINIYKTGQSLGKVTNLAKDISHITNFFKITTN
jgi:hypothetical protein